MLLTLEAEPPAKLDQADAGVAKLIGPGLVLFAFIGVREIREAI